MKDWIIDEWRHGWKFYSVWLSACVVALPSLYDMLQVAGYLGDGSPLPDGLKWAVRTIGIAAIVVRFVKQQKPDAAQ